MSCWSSLELMSNDLEVTKCVKNGSNIPLYLHPPSLSLYVSQSQPPLSDYFHQHSTEQKCGVALLLFWLMTKKQLGWISFAQHLDRFPRKKKFIFLDLHFSTHPQFATLALAHHNKIFSTSLLKFVGLSIYWLVFLVNWTPFFTISIPNPLLLLLLVKRTLSKKFPFLNTTATYLFFFLLFLHVKSFSALLVGLSFEWPRTWLLSPGADVTVSN